MTKQEWIGTIGAALVGGGTGATAGWAGAAIGVAIAVGAVLLLIAISQD
jgi:hypothetical protein